MVLEEYVFRLCSAAVGTLVFIRKSVIGSNIHIEVNQCRLTLDRVLKLFTTFLASHLEVLVT